MAHQSVSYTPPADRHGWASETVISTGNLNGPSDEGEAVSRVLDLRVRVLLDHLRDNAEIKSVVEVAPITGARNFTLRVRVTWRWLEPDEIAAQQPAD